MHRSVLLTTVLMACSPASSLHIEPPDLTGAETVLAAVRSGSNQRVWTFDADAESFELASIPNDQRVEVELVVLETKREQLGLPLGSIEESSDADAIPLPLGDNPAFITSVEDGAAGAWTATEPSGSLRSFRIDDPFPCPELQVVDRYELDFAEFAAVTQIHFGRILIRERGVVDRAIVLESSFGVITRVDVPTDLSFDRGFVRSGQSVWLADDEHVWRAAIREPEFIRATATTTVTSSPIRAFAVSGTDIFVHGRDGDLWRVPEEGMAEPLFVFDDIRGGGLFIASVALDETLGRIASTNSLTNQVVLYEDGVVLERPVPFERGIRSLVWSRADQTFYAGSIDSNVYRLDGNDWTLLQRPTQTVTQIRSMASIGQSVLFVAGDILGQYARGRYCVGELPGGDFTYLGAHGAKLNLVADGNDALGNNARLEVRALDASL